MASDPVAALRTHREEGVRILIALIEATPETVAATVEHERAWARDLIPLVEPFGAIAARFEPLSPMKDNESESIRGVVPLNAPHFEAMRSHAVRMFRLDKLFDRIPIETPAKLRRGPGRSVGVSTFGGMHHAGGANVKNIIPTGYCGIREAFDRLGREIFRETWTGTEIHSRALPSPEDIQAKKEKQFEHARRARRASRAVRSGFASRRIKPAQRRSLPDPKDPNYLAERHAHDRREEAESRLLSLLYDATLSAYLKRTDGHISAIPSHLWQAVDFSFSLNLGSARWNEVSVDVAAIREGSVLVKEADLSELLGRSVVGTGREMPGPADVYVMIGREADRLARERHGNLWRTRRDDYLHLLWRAVMTGEIELVRLDPSGRAEPFSRDVLQRLIGDAPRLPQAVRCAPEDQPPWDELAAIEPEDFSPNWLASIFEPLFVRSADLRRWECSHVALAAMPRLSPASGNEEDQQLDPDLRDDRLASTGRRDQADRKESTKRRDADIRAFAHEIWSNEPTLSKPEVAQRIIESDHEFLDQRVREDKSLACETVERIIRRPPWARKPRRSRSGKR